MKLKAILETLEGLPEHFHELYTEKNGKYLLTGVEGIKTQADIDKLNEANVKEREAHKATKAKLESYISLAENPEELQQKLDRMAELEEAAKGKLDENQLNNLVEARLKTKIAPLQRDLDKKQKDLEALTGEVTTYKTKERQRTIHDKVREAALKGNILNTAVEDVLMLAERVFDIDESGAVITKDNSGVTPGVDPHVWLTDMQQKRPHWWAASQGGGAKGGGAGNGGGGSNPFSAEGWNMTEQGQLIKTDRARAEQMAKAAGTTIGGLRPVAKK